MATLTLITPVITSVLLGAAAAAVGGDKFLNNGSVILYIKNGGVSSINLTIDAQSNAGVNYTDPVIAVAAAAERLIGPFRTDIFNDSNGYVNLTYSTVTGVTVSPIQLT